MVAVITIATVPYLAFPFVLEGYSKIMNSSDATNKITLFGSFVSAFVTILIAYRQYVITKTQRDIAHNTIRLEYSGKLITIYNDMTTLYRELYSLERVLPYELRGKRAVDFKIRTLEGLSIEGKEKNVKKWATDYIEKTKEIKKLHDKCWINQQECKFMLDKKTYQTIFDFGNKAGQLFESKKNSTEDSIRFYTYKTYNNIIKTLDDELDTLLSEVTHKMTPYMDIRDIIAPRKFD